MAEPTLTIDNSRTQAWYRSVWRWHFYAGLFTVPFILWLSVTGGIYLFEPQIQALIDRPYNNLALKRKPQSPAALAAAAQRAVPGSVLHRYVLPAQDNDARQIVVGVGSDETRVYVHPSSGAVLKTVGEQDRFLRMVFYLHGELMAGRWGSTLVELAASWTVIMLLTGLFLWWPRGRSGLAGVLYPRLRPTRRVFWRDMHAVTGIWISLFAVFLILSGLPWAKNWGGYLNAVRDLTGTTSAVARDWSQGSAEEAALRAKLDIGARAALAANAEVSDSERDAPASVTEAPLAALDRLVPVAQALALAPPVEVSPPAEGKRFWRVQSQSANRPQRASAELDPVTGAIVGRRNFAQGHWLDRTVGYGIAIHEGAFLGLANQLFNLTVLLGLILLSVSSVVLWWRRKPLGQLGAPLPVTRKRHSVLLVALVLALAVLLPSFGLSLVIVLLVDRYLLSRCNRAVRYLALQGRDKA